jgi:hypothetical protein
MTILAALGLLLPMPWSAIAGEADVTAVAVKRLAEGIWRFEVTVAHDDEGWDHYADRWEVLSPDGSVLGTRILHHPHENEQPFTRRLSGVPIPPEVESVTIRAHDSIHGFGGREEEIIILRP